MYTGSEARVLEQNMCELCAGGLQWDQENGENICTSCGAVSTVASEVFSELSPALGLTHQPLSLRKPSVLEDIGVSTIIGGRDVDANGKRIGYDQNLRQLRRLDTIVSWDSKKRRLGKVSMEVRRVAQSLGMNSLVAERAFEIYLKEFNAKSVKARSLAAVAAASVCAACRELDIARPPNDVVARNAGVNEKMMRHYYRIIVSFETNGNIPTPAGYVSSIATKASLRGTTERMAHDILNKVKGSPLLVGKRPVSIAAAALYLASVKVGDRTTQLRLAYAAGVTPITIRKRALEISGLIEPPN